jgi:hypothetical protein
MVSFFHKSNHGHPGSIPLKKDDPCIKAFFQIDLNRLLVITSVNNPKRIFAAVLLKIVKLKIAVVIRDTFADLIIGVGNVCLTLARDLEVDARSSCLGSVPIGP